MLDKGRLENLYEQGYSIAEIARKLNASSYTVVYWMDHFGIKRRTRSEALYRKYNPQGDPFKIRTNLNQYENFLLGLALGLFWGEGMKKSRTGVRLGNTDPFVILYFKEFLVDVCGVPRTKIKYSLQLFGDVSQRKAVDFWCDILQLTPDLLKVSMVKLHGKGTYRVKNKLGVLQIACHNTKFKTIFDNYLCTLKISSYADVAQMVEHVHGETHETLAQMLRN